MARLKLLEPYGEKPAGAVIVLPGGVASVLVMRKVAEYAPTKRKAKKK